MHPNEAEYAALRRKAEQEASLWTAIERQQRAQEELGDLTRRCIALLEGVMAQQADIGRRLARLEQGGIDTVDTTER